MNFGNEIEHLAQEAKRNGQAETPWLMLRNVYFRTGTPEQGWQAMVDCFTGMGIKATSEWRRLNGREVEFVLLTPKRLQE